jgi:RHS repeat-associated protein
MALPQRPLKASHTTKAGTFTSTTSGRGDTTEYEYDGTGDRTSMTDPDKDETKWTYDATHDVETVTSPNGETTTITRDAHGNPELISRPAPGSSTQSTAYEYNEFGEPTRVEDPLKRVWKYEYDSAGDRTVEIDPAGNERSWGYNEDSQEISTVSPRGHTEGAKESEFKTTIERDQQGRKIKVTDPLGHKTKYAYDPNGNLESETDAEANTTTYNYNADNQVTKVEQPNKATTETEYDGAGAVTSQTDGNKDTTKYTRNVLEQVSEVTDPLGRKAKREYDADGNLSALTDAAKRVTAYEYDPADHLTEVTYSEGETPSVKYEYDPDGNRTKLVDGTGTTTYKYDQLDRLTESKNGHGDTDGYEYDLANEQTKLTYPNGEAVSHGYDSDGRLKSVTDWLEHTTEFAYDPDSELATTTFPSSTADKDTYAYDDADSISEVKMLKGAETLASIGYLRNNDGEITKATSTGLPGEATSTFAYDKNSRLTEGAATTYEYDAANNPTAIANNTYTYNEANELEAKKLEATTVNTYTYNELGERTKTTPTTGPATTYGYDQAGNLTTVTRPHEGETPAINDTYAYDGNGLRTTQTISGTTSHLTWDMTGQLPTILSDNTNSYIYGPNAQPIEQINTSTGTVAYLHHDQQGSTRLITGSTGKTEATYTYRPYGELTGSTGTAATPLGYDGQYTSSDTGLIYLRARTYDPASAQFLTADPLASVTGTLYAFTKDNPVSYVDPGGQIFGIPGTPSTNELVEGITHLAGAVATAASIVTAGCAVATAPTGVGEVVCGAVGSVALASGAVATAGDTYLAVTGTQSPGSAVFDALGLATGAGGEVVEGALADGELSAYAKAYGALLSAAAYGEPYAEGVAGAQGYAPAGCEP